MNKRVAIFIASFHGGGAERVMMTIANDLADRNYKIELLVANNQGIYKKELSNKVEIVDLNVSRVIYTLPKLVSYIRRTKVKIILATVTHVNILAVISKLISGEKTRVVIREADTIGSRKSKGKGLSSRLLPFFRNYFYSKADQVITPSKGVKDGLVSMKICSSDKIQVIPNPVDMKLIESQSRLPVNEILKNYDGADYILGVGRLTEDKDFETLIDSYKLLLEKSDHKIKLIILGEGDLREKLEKRVKEYGLQKMVLMPGFVSNPYPVIKMARCFVLSSRSEGLPNALIQAVCLGTPVVSTDCLSGPREILENGKWGELVPVQDIDKMSEAIIRVLNGKVIPQETLIEYAAKTYEKIKITDQYIRVLQL